MIVEPVPTNPRSPLRRTLRLAGMVAPALLLVVVVAIGVLGPRAEAAPTPSPVAVVSASPSSAPSPSASPFIPPSASPITAPDVDAPPAAFAGFHVTPIADVVAAHAASARQGMVAIDGWLTVPESQPRCAGLPLGGLGPWCRRFAIIVSEPWTGESANSRPLAPHLRVTVPLGIRLPESVQSGDPADPVRVLVLGRFEREGSPCDSAGWGACEAGFIVDRIVYAAGDRIALTTLLAPGLDREKRANPLESITAPDVALLALYARPAVIVAVDPSTERLASGVGAAPQQGSATWYVRWYSAQRHEVRWRLLDGATLAVLGEGAAGPMVVSSELAPVQAR